MSQQTQVDRVRKRWPQFLKRFPSPAVAASSAVAEIIDEWSGLGYNRRAVNLHRCAVATVEHHGGDLPRSLSDLMSLPGVGPYTARALRVFAFEEHESVLDTNVARILARTQGGSLSRVQAQDLADKSRNGDPWIWNQAILDVGAKHCRPTPRCHGCPLAKSCSWFASSLAGPDPASGSAGVSGRQSRFEGSDRQGRARLVRALRSGPLTDAELAVAAGWPNDRPRVDRAVLGLIRDGLAVGTPDGGLMLPGATVSRLE